MVKKKIILTKGEIAELSQEEVYKRFEKLLHKICNKFYIFERNSDGHDELFSIALIAFVRAFDKYDYAKGTAFSSYLESVTKLAILHEYQLKGIPNEFKPVSENGEVAKYGNKYLLMTVAGAGESPISNNKFRRADEGESRLLDYIPDNSSERKIDLFLSNKEIEDVFERILNTKRNKPFKNAFIDYMNGKTQLQISEKYGFSQSYLSRRLNSIVKEIKNYYLQLI